MFRSRAYGLHIASSIPIDGLPTITDDAPPDCELRIAPVEMLAPEDALVFDTSHLTEQGEPGTRMERSRSDPGTFVFAFLDDTRFRIEDEGRRVTAQSPTPEDMATYFLGPILAFIVRRRGMLTLHAGAVAIDGEAIVIAGASGAGKSTTTAAFLERGASLLTDDVAVIGWKAEAPHVFPGYPRVRLWDDSAALLYGSAEALPLLTPTWSKRFVDASARFAAESVPLRAIIVLARRDDASTRARRLHGHEAAIALLVRASMRRSLSAEQRKTELDEVTRLAERIPIIEVTPRNDLGATGELLDVIAAAVL